MSELISSWLNDEVQLSKKIINFERDFANGYCFAELLAKYNQQLNFDKFLNRLHTFPLNINDTSLNKGTTCR